MAYKADGLLIIFATGAEPAQSGLGHKATSLLGVKVVVAQSFEHPPLEPRWHGRPSLQFPDGVTLRPCAWRARKSSTRGLSGDIAPRQDITLRITRKDGSVVTKRSGCALTAVIGLLRHGGILPFVLRQLLS
jgi:aconitate hydratase